MDSFGKRLRWLRQQQKLTQTQVAEATSITRGNICNYELDKFIPTGENLIRLSTFFKVPIDWLLTGNQSGNNMHIINEQERILLSQFRSLAPSLQEQLLDFLTFLSTKNKSNRDAH